MPEFLLFVRFYLLMLFTRMKNMLYLTCLVNRRRFEHYRDTGE